MMTWNMAIRRYVANWQFKESLLVFYQMRQLGLQLDHLALAAVIKCCAMKSDVHLGESLHGHVTKHGSNVTLVQKALMDMYARFNMLHKSVLIFEEMGWKDATSWNILMSGYSRLGFCSDAMDIFYLMHIDKVVTPNAISIAIILPTLTQMRAFRTAKSIHSYTIKMGMLDETLVGNNLVSMYGRCGLIDSAHKVFELIPFKDIVSWNSIIAAYSENGLIGKALSLFYQMVSFGFRPNNISLVSVLPLICYNYKIYHWGKIIHCHTLRFHCETDTSVSNAIVVHYARIGDMRSAVHVFENILAKDTVSWNSIIAGCALNGLDSMSLELFQEMTKVDMMPDSSTIATVLSVCAKLHHVFAGRMVHGYVSKNMVLLKDTHVSNALVSFYGKCKDMEKALQIFLAIPVKDLISWNAMLSAFACNEKWEEVIGCSKCMLECGNKLDHVSILSLLQACARLNFKMVREVHGHSIRLGLSGILTVGNAMLDAYAKSGSTDYALRVFEGLSQPNIISFNSMIVAFTSNGYQREAEALFDKMDERDIGTWNVMLQYYAHNCSFDEALHLFRELQIQGLCPDSASIMAILAVCACLASVNLVKQCHSFALRNHFNNLHLQAAFLDAYSKSGSINYAWKLFEAAEQRDVVTFTAMIGGFARNGMAKEAVKLYYQMLEQNMKLDHVMMISLLSACSHAGLSDEGWKLFKSMEINHGIKLTIEHYACILDLFARNGQFKEAYTLLSSMPYEVNAKMWGTLLGACKVHGEVEIAQLAAKQLFEMEAENIGNYVVMSNLYALERRWNDVKNIRELMKSRELRKPAGCSWVEVEKKRHIFVAGDLVHPQRKMIYLMLCDLNKEIREST